MPHHTASPATLPTRELALLRVPVIELAGSDAEPAGFAKAELERYLAEILGDAAPVESAAGATVCRRITLRVAPERFTSDEAHAWRADDDAIEIEAGGELGLVFAVYAFLRDVCGCVFAAPGPDGELVPRASPLVVRVTPVRREPRIWYRGIQCYFFEPPERYQQQIDWLTKNGYNYVEYHLAAAEDGKVLREQVDPKTGRPLFPEAMGPSSFDEAYFRKHLLPHVRRRGLKLDFNHHNLWFWIPPHVYKDSHPEWFALVDGKRASNLNQLCLCTSNPAVIDELVRRVKAFLRANPEVKIVGVVPEDGLGMCQCEACLAGDVDRNDAFAPPRDHCAPEGENRSLINRYARLLNTVARAIREEFRGVLVGGCAYVDLTMPPRDTPLEPNLAIQVAVYWRDGCRPLTAAGTSRLNRFFFNVVQRWRRALPGRLLLYEYYMGMMAQRCLPYPMAEVIGADWRELGEAGVEGASIQCCAGATHSFALNLAAFGRCAWGEFRSSRALIDDYARAQFGAAAPAVRWIFERWQDAMVELASATETDRAVTGLNTHEMEPVLLPDGSSIVSFWRALGGDAAVTDAFAAARRLDDSPRVRRNLDGFGMYLNYCRLAAAATGLALRAKAVRDADAVGALELLRQAVEREYPAVIDYLREHPMPGWVLPRARSIWEGDLRGCARDAAELAERAARTAAPPPRDGAKR